MSASVHPAAPHHLPSFITALGDTDILLASKDIGFFRRFVLHAIDATGLVYAMLLRIQVLILPIKELVLGGH